MTDDAPTILYLIRHGQTAWNVEEVFRGRADVPLDDTGHAQARATASVLATEPLTGVYSSPLQRATETAQPIAEAHGLGVEIDERLTDLDFGEWQGKTLTEVRQTWPELFALWERDPGAVEFPGGESLPIVRERAMAAIEDLAARHRGKVVAVVSHRVVTKVALCAVLGLGDTHFWQIRQDTGCINRLERSDTGWTVVTLNDRCHLRDLATELPRDF